MPNPELPKHAEDAIKREEDAVEGLTPKNVEAAIRHPGVPLNEQHALREALRKSIPSAKGKHLKNAENIKKEFSE